MAQNDIVLFSNVGLRDQDTSGQTSTVGETSVANNGNQILLTGNWYATRSLDGGNSWAHMSPSTFFPHADDGFCCDQTLIYDPGRDITIWVLQYSVLDGTGTNTLRVAVKRGRTLNNNDWEFWDFSPEGVNPAWSGEWFDYNHAALSENFLYVGSNVFREIPEAFTRSVILRIPLDDLAAGQNLDFDFFSTTDNGSLRCTQGAGRVMYFAGHNSNSQLRLYRWPEEADDVDMLDIDVTAWNAGNYDAAVPGSPNWLSRADPRITAAWVGRGQIGFMWTVDSQANRPFPFIRTVRIDEESLDLVDEPDLWHSQTAMAYPAAAPNRHGDVGITLSAGGGALHPSMVVGAWDDAQGGWRLALTERGTNSPGDGKWGDYNACTAKSPDCLTWLASGFTLQGGSLRQDIEPRIVHFGQQRFDTAARRGGLIS